MRVSTALNEMRVYHEFMVNLFLAVYDDHKLLLSFNYTDNFGINTLRNETLNYTNPWLSNEAEKKYENTTLMI